MKQTLLSLLILSVLDLFAPRADAQNWYLGARGGANIATEVNTPGSSQGTGSDGTRTGLLAGIQLERRFGDTWSFAGELLYDQKGTHVDYNESGTIVDPPNLDGQPFSMTGTTDLKLNYLEFSLRAKARFSSGDFRPYVFAGPSIGIFLSGKQHDTYSYVEGSDSHTVDTTRAVPVDQFDWNANPPGAWPATLDVSIVGGGGAEYKLGPDEIVFVDAAYAYGFKDMAHYPDHFPWAKSRDIRLAAGIMFPID